VHLTGLFLPQMVERGSGKVLNVASTAAFQPGPFMSVYYATKAFDLFFTEAIANELKGTGVSATALCAGPTRTEFQQRADMLEAKVAGDNLMMSAEKVAQIAYDALMKNKVIVIPGAKNRFLAFLTRFFPRALVRNATRAINENRRMSPPS
jgi:short-subunit dehydrogenase